MNAIVESLGAYLPNRQIDCRNSSMASDTPLPTSSSLVPVRLHDGIHEATRWMSSYWAHAGWLGRAIVMMVTRHLLHHPDGSGRRCAVWAFDLHWRSSDRIRDLTPARRALTAGNERSLPCHWISPSPPGLHPVWSISSTRPWGVKTPPKNGRR